MIKKISEEEVNNYRPLNFENGIDTLAQAVAYTLTPIPKPESHTGPWPENGWEKVTYYGERLEDPSTGGKKPEYVYVLVNKAHPGVCKIGMTTTSIPQRVKEINSATGVHSPWYPVHGFKCVNSRYLEQEVHAYLEHRGLRINPSREMFNIDSTTALSIIHELGKNYKLD